MRKPPYEFLESLLKDINNRDVEAIRTHISEISLVMGISSIALFAFTLIKQSINHNQRWEQHKMAGKILSQAKAELRLKQNEWSNEKAEDAVINAYLDQLISTINDLPQIPEKHFIKYKHKHVRKVEFSKFVDRHKATPWLWCKFLFLLKGLDLYKEREEKNKSKLLCRDFILSDACESCLFLFAQFIVPYRSI